MDGDFRSTTLPVSEASRNLHYNFLASPVPFECSDPILSTSLGSSAPLHAMSSRLCNPSPSPLQHRVSTPYPVGFTASDSVTAGKDWPGPSPESRMYPPSWTYEPAVHFGQQFPGPLLPMQNSNSHTVHHYAFPQTWHHAVAPQTFSGYNPHGSDYWYGEFSVIDGLSTLEEGSGAIEQDSRVTSSTEVSPWKPLQLVLPPVSDLLNAAHGNTKSPYERTSPMETPQGENCQIITYNHAELNQDPGKSNHSRSHKKEAKTQTPWKLKKEKALQPPQTQQLCKKNRNPGRRTNPTAYFQQKTVQREREKAIRNEIQELSTILPWADLQNTRPSRKAILERAISHITRLQENIGEECRQKGLTMEDLTMEDLTMEDITEELKGEDNCSFNDGYSNNPSNDCCVEISDELIRVSVHSESVSVDSESTAVVNSPVISISPSSELSSQELEEVEEPSSLPQQNNQTESKVNRVKRPMNAFLLFSQQYRKVFKVLHPGRDNRKISTLLAEHWRKLKAEDKLPYREKAKELMRRTKESHPEFKYCDAKKDSSGGDKKHGSCNQGFRIGSHNLRQRCESKSKKRKGLDQSHKHSKAEKDSKQPLKQKEDTKQSKRKTPDLIHISCKTNSPQKPAQTEALRKVCGSNQGANPHVGNTGEAGIRWGQSGTCDVWVQCENCKKWHMLPDNSDTTSLPDKWYCWMDADSAHRSCLEREIPTLNP